MATTLTTDIPAWIPDVIGASAYDATLDSALTLSGIASVIPDIAGKPGDVVIIPTINTTTPADNLAENVAAVTEKLTGGSITMLIKEGVKAIAWSDRSKVQSSQDINQIAGQRIGNGIADRVELDLGAALLAGRNLTGEVFSANFDVAALRALKRRIPAGIRRRGPLTLVGSDAVIEELLSDPILANAATFGSTEVLQDGQLSRPIFGISRVLVVDDSVLANITVGANPASPPAVLFASGNLFRAVQTGPTVELERKPLERLTNLVGTILHGEAVQDSRGVVATAVGQ